MQTVIPLTLFAANQSLLSAPSVCSSHRFPPCAAPSVNCTESVKGRQFKNDLSLRFNFKKEQCSSLFITWPCTFVVRVVPPRLSGNRGRRSCSDGSVADHSAGGPSSLTTLLISHKLAVSSIAHQRKPVPACSEWHIHPPGFCDSAPLKLSMEFYFVWKILSLVHR